MMDDRMRVSDADRERVTTRLREHFADGRLTSEELDERVTSALNAKTFGDLRAVMADLPEPEPTGPQAGPPPWASGPQWGPPAYRHRRGPRLLPLALLILLAAVILPGGGWIFLGFFKVILLFWLVLCIAGVFAAARFRRRVRRNGQSGRRNWPGDYR
ncbi:MAG TPA: DUF1707 domain-containing protein [Streptosporangiaceae bacterium]|jgi:hypothetical protein|nr:DUF1707 domain-containing protein [Streptosporangiaceae bacterium]